MEAPARVYTDLDHTLLGEGGLLSPRALEAVGRLLSMGVAVVPVTSKSAPEALLYIERLGLDRGPLPAAVAETGSLIVLAGRLRGLATAEAHGVPVVPLARRRPDPRALAPGGCRAVPLSRMDPEEAAEATGLPQREAELATKRLYDEAFLVEDPRCRAELAARAAAMGFTVLEGRRFVHVTSGPGKAGGVRGLEALLGRPRLRFLLGDSPLDKDLLELPGVAVVIPRGAPPRPMVRPARADYTVAPSPAPEGWVWAAREVVEPLTPHAAPGQPL